MLYVYINILLSSQQFQSTFLSDQTTELEDFDLVVASLAGFIFVENEGDEFSDRGS